MSVILAGLLLLRLPTVWGAAPDDYDEAAAYEAIAAELQRGASLRSALAAVFPGTRLSRLAMSGQPMSWVAADLESRSERRDGFIGAGLQLAARSGAPAVELFLSLAARVRSGRSIAAKKRVLSAQARASALVVGLLPLFVGVVLVGARSGGTPTDSGVAGIAMFAGLVMELCGAAVVYAIARRAGR